MKCYICKKDKIKLYKIYTVSGTLALDVCGICFDAFKALELIGEIPVLTLPLLINLKNMTKSCIQCFFFRHDAPSRCARNMNTGVGTNSYRYTYANSGCTYYRISE